MSKRWVVPGISVLLAAVAGVLVWVWYRPYQLPPVPKELNAAGVGLDFGAERAVYALAITGQVSSGESLSTAPDKARAPAQYAKALKLAAAGKGEEALTYLRAAVQGDPGNLVYGNELRRQLVRLGHWGDLQGIWATPSPMTRAQQIQLTLAYIDRMADPDMNDIDLAKFSVKSMEQAERLLNENPYDWMAHYARGVNNLYWPKGLYRGAKTLADLGFCVAVVEQLDLKDGWLDMSYVAYGDALVKDDQVSAGYRVWQDGYRRFPRSSLLEERVKTGKDGAVALVARERGLDAFTRPRAGLTDLEPMWATARER